MALRMMKGSRHIHVCLASQPPNKKCTGKDLCLRFTRLGSWRRDFFPLGRRRHYPPELGFSLAQHASLFTILTNPIPRGKKHTQPHVSYIWPIAGSQGRFWHRRHNNKKILRFCDSSERRPKDVKTRSGSQQERGLAGLNTKYTPGRSIFSENPVDFQPMTK